MLLAGCLPSRRRRSNGGETILPSATPALAMLDSLLAWFRCPPGVTPPLRSLASSALAPLILEIASRGAARASTSSVSGRGSEPSRGAWASTAAALEGLVAAWATS